MKKEWFLTLLALCFLYPTLFASQVLAQVNSNPPPSPLKLLFIHASVGEAWLADNYGALGAELAANNYFVSDYTFHNNIYGWPGHDYCSWWPLFSNDSSISQMLNYHSQTFSYQRLADPGGVNDIIMIKPCFFQYQCGIKGSPDDEPAASGEHDCANCLPTENVATIKRLMLDLLDVIKDNPDTFFVFVTAPAATEEAFASVGGAENARALSTWMATEWLQENYYPNYKNAMVFDFYNVLTSNDEGEGDVCPDPSSDSDAGLDTGNHHRIWSHQIQHQIGYSQDYSVKATAEFVPLLNARGNDWLAWLNGSSATPTPAASPTPTSALTPTATPTPVPGDVNGDGQVDLADALQILIAWLANGVSEDLNGDGQVNGIDLGYVIRGLIP